MSNSFCTRLKTRHYYLFELFIFCRVFAVSISMIAISVLIQDKICSFTYNQTANFCQNIESNINATTDLEHTKDDVLAESTKFGNYKNIVECIPMAIWSLFVGSFLDNYEAGGTFLILVLNIFGNIFSNVIYMLTVIYYDSSPYYLLVASLSAMFTGGIICFTTTAYRYITVHSNEMTRAFKFVVIEIICVIGISLAVCFGGLILVNQIGSNILRSYNRNFIISLLFDLLSIVMLYFLYHFEITQKEQMKNRNEGSHNEQINRNISTINLSTTSIDTTETNIKSLQSTSNILKPRKNFFKIVFDLHNIQQTMHCLFRPREKNVRLLIYLLNAVFFIQILVNSGINVVLLQFAEKVYEWSAQTYAIFYALSNIITTAVLGLSSMCLVKKWKLTDTTMIVTAQISTFLKYLIIGLYLSPKAYLISLVVGSLSGFSLISIRTKLSKIVPSDEIGKIFSIGSILEALVPIFASIIYSNLFSISIASYPGLIYQFSAFLMILSLIVMVFEYKYSSDIEFFQSNIALNNDTA